MTKRYSKTIIHSLTLLTAKQRRLIAFVILSFLLAPVASAQVEITAPSLTIKTCGTFPTDYSSLDNIVIAETSNGNFNYQSGNSVTLILSAPSNFEFLPGQGSVSVSGNNISSGTIEVTANTITITYRISGTNKTDVIKIIGIKVRAINGPATNQHITRTDGTGAITGDGNGTSHATLSSEILPTPTITTNSSQISCSGSSTNIALTSNPSGASFSWVTGTVDNVTGASSGSGNTIAQTLTSANRPGTVEYIVTPTLNGCSGAPATITNTVNPKATVNTVPDQEVCNNSGTAAITFSSPTTGGDITYSWSNDNTNIGLASGGTGNIPSFTATNNTGSAIKATITVTPAYSNGGKSCTGTPTSFTITVNPVATVNAITDQAACVNTTTPAITFNSPTPGTIDYSWTNNNTGIGLAASGTGNLPAFTAKNAGVSPVTSVITVTPIYKTSVVSCPGTPASFNYTVYPKATVNAVANQTVCDNSPTADIHFTSAGTGTITYNWTNNAPYIGLASSGTGDISSFSPVNDGSTPIIATITVTPSYNGCPGTPTTFTITVNPVATMDNVADQVFCNNSASGQIKFTSPTTGTIIYNWSNSNTDIGLAATGTGNMASFNATNTGTSPISSAITVIPSISNAGKVCAGTPEQFNIVVNPTPTINAIADQTFCNGSSVSSMAVTGSVPGAVYTWVNDNSTIGLLGAGNGNLPAFTATNTGNAPVTAAIRLNATYTNGGVSCYDVSSFNITVNPTATVNSVDDQVVCNNAPTQEVDFNTSATGAGTVTYHWMNSDAGIGLAGSGTGNIPSFTAKNTGNSPVTATITVTATYSNGGEDCDGTPETFTITVNPTPKVTDIEDQIACNKGAFTPAAFTTTANGGTTTYSWTNSNSSIGLAASGTGNLPTFTTSNSTNDVATATIKVTPVFANAGVSCEGPENSFNIIVNPTATVNVVGDQTVCNNSNTSAVHFSTATGGPGTLSYHWENNKTSIGLASSGTGDIPAFKALNNGTAPVTATITVTPYYLNGATSCAGTSQTFTITVNPTANVNSISNQTVCNNGLTSAVNFATSATGGGVTYSWTNNNATIGLASAGTGNIPSFKGLNTTNAPVTAQITVTPLFSNGGTACQGVSQSFTITVNPTPTVNSVDGQTLCSNTPANAISFTGNVSNTIYRWTNTATSIGLAASGNGAISSFTAMNSGSTAVNAVVTVTPDFINGGVSCKGSPKTFTIVVNPLPVPSLSGPNPICPNSTDVYKTESGMNNYTWTQTGGTITSGGTKDDASATITWGNTTGVKTIYINYTDNNGCTGATSVTVANGEGSSPGLSGPAKVCLNSTGNVYTTESGKINYSWNIPQGGTIVSGGGVNDATATVRWDEAGTKTITVNYADVGGCNAATPTSFPVVVNALPVATISGNKTVCLNSGTSKIIFAGTTGTAPYTFTYNINNGPDKTISTVAGNNTISIDQPSGTAGTFSYNLVNVQEASSITCSQAQTGNATVIVKPLPTATISGTTAVCANSAAPNITFTGSTGTAPYTFTYNMNGGANLTVKSSGNSVTVPVNTSTAGKFTYSLLNVKEGSANSCSVAAGGTAIVTVNPIPTASISGSTTVCIGSASPDLTFTGANGTAPYIFSYSINGGAAKTVKTTSGNSVTVAAPTDVAGSYTYQLLSVQDGSSTACSQAISAASATVKIDAKPVGGILSPDVITGACTGSNSGSISLSGQLGNVTRWEFSTNGGASWSTVSPNVTSTTLTYNNITATSLYRAVVQNGVCGDTAVSKVAIVVVSPIFTPVVKYLPTLTICVGDSVTMAASGLSNDKTSIVDGAFDQANPAGWSVDGGANNFPANGDNGNVHPWTETNGPKTFYGGTEDAITYDSQFDKKFAIANGQLTTTLETPVFSLVGMVSPTFDFYQSYHLLPGTTARIEISTDGGAHYTGILADYQPGDFGVPDRGLVHTFVPLTNYIGLDNLRVKFTYSSTGNSSWALDNLTLVNTFLPVSYLWHSEGYTYSTQTITVSPPVGTHVFDLVTKTGECSITTTELTVVVNGLPTIDPGTAAICSNTSAQTLTLPYTNPNYSPENYSITWNAPSNGLQPATGTLNSSNSIAVALPAGLPAATYSGMVTVTNSTGCISPAVPFSFVVNQTPVIANQAPAAICSGSSVTLNSTSFTGTNAIPANTTYSWSAPTVPGITGLTSGSAKAAFATGNLVNTTSEPIAVVYSVTPKSPAACPGTPFTITVTVNPTQILSTIPANATLCPEPFTTLSTTFNVEAANATIFQWQENRGSGWVNLTNNANYSGVTTNTLTVNNITEAMEGYQYRTSLANPSFCYSTYSESATLLITNVWKGTTSTDWSTPSNWWGNVVPDINCQYVIVPAVSTKLYPILKGTETQEVRNIVIRKNASVTVTQSATLQVRGAIYSNIANYQYGYMDATDGRIELNGGSSHTYTGTDTAQIIAGSLFKIRTLKDLQISNPLGATVESTPNDTLNITGTLSFGPVNNTILHTGDNITLISLAAQTARVADITNGLVNSGNNFDGDVIVERYINTGSGSNQHGMAWEFLAVPTTGQTVKQSWMENGSFAKTGYGTQIPSTYGTAAGFDLHSPFASIKYYKAGSIENTSSPDWIGVTNANNQLYNTAGYMLFVAGDRSVAPPLYKNPVPTRMRSKGKLFTYTVSLPLAGASFSSIGNPYASAIDMRKVFDQSPDADPFFSTWASPKPGSYGYGSFVTYSKSGNDFVATPGGFINNNVESGQAFLVQTTLAKGGDINFNETSKTAGSTSTVFRIPSGSVGQIRTNFYSNTGKNDYLIDGTLSEFNDDYNQEVDRNDAWKIYKGGENLYIVKPSKNLIIERTKNPTEKDTVFFALTGLLKQNYRFEFVCKYMSATGLQAFLVDNYLDTDIPLNMEDTTIINFNVNNDKASSASDRFEIVFRQKPVSPVEISFDAHTKDHAVEVLWNVTNEKNMHQYEVERSTDGNFYTKRCVIPAKNTDSSTYSWEDDHLLSGKYYYRLKSISNTGRITYSQSVKVVIGDGHSSIKIYPNPITNGMINLQFINQPAGKYDLRLLNNLGQVIISKQIERNEGSDVQTIQWNYKLAHGTYQLEIFQPDGQLKIIKVLY